jgi:hypothetical protein
MKTITDDPEGFFDSGGWSFLDPESDVSIPWGCFPVWFMVFNATFNNISVMSWQSVLLVEVTGVSRENHQQS